MHPTVGMVHMLANDFAYKIRLKRTAAMLATPLAEEAVFQKTRLRHSQMGCKSLGPAQSVRPNGKIPHSLGDESAY